MSISIIRVINIKKNIIYQEQCSLLLILKLNNINIEYQCQSGYCGICRIELIQGKIFYPEKKPMAAVCKKGEIFPCCCHPNGNITIKI
ncbi:2Fe-2S iron-sulfur cluster binding domain-containing protein [Buchnera aphidicola (Hyperomyzus lactucae)]|uniref:2Fe-2S iron-sulfur cluster binding domain-containing protein n=1 Tax=Buchnera aphidicola (Hyperomyzus lactucae) TaxID=1241860 RepID=A0A4D6Y307_9GAMM|nr:class I ribonucleotide reductase maintenance protein YfaE [Buchnera aphidicola]QCI20914.1 2Fe-2S iron-sulfur cluster binding domain-containing protein [Buchnera aphidicola (Hyperomyzus lactucae)]